MSQVSQERVKLGEADPQKKSAWDPTTHGYGKHSYHHVDPAEINPEEYARSLRGEEQHYGDVREYNSGDNEKHPECTASLNWLSRIGTEFETNAPGYEGNWIVADMPRIKAPRTFIVVQNATELVQLGQGHITKIAADDLGVTVDETNHFKQVITKVIKQGRIERNTKGRREAQKTEEINLQGAETGEKPTNETTPTIGM